MNREKRAVLLVVCLLAPLFSAGQTVRYDFHQLLLESEVVFDTDSTNQNTFDPSIEVQVVSFKERVAAEFVQHNLSEDFASLALQVKTIPSRSYFTVRISGFTESRTVAHVMDQLVKSGFSPLKIRQK